MDQNSEQKIVENLNLTAKDKTMIVITHRNALLSICDRVLVMENGKVVADNTPEQLGIKKLASS